MDDDITKLYSEISTDLQALAVLSQPTGDLGKARSIQRTLAINRAVRELDFKQQRAAQAHQQLQKQVLEMQELMRTTALLNSSFSVTHVLNEVIDTLIRLSGAERAYLMLLEADGHGMTTRVARNWSRETLNEEDIIFSEGVVNATLQQGETILTVNAQTDERFYERASVLQKELLSIICVPLKRRGQIIGVIYADNHWRKAVFQLEIVPLVTLFADQAAIAIENAQLFTAIQESRESIVNAREEERRRLRRELHDGLGPTLASFTLALDSLRPFLTHDETDRPTAQARLADLKIAAQGALADVRRVSFDLRPPSLDELGLAQAIRTHAAKLQPSGLAITVHIDDALPVLSAALEVAIFRITIEAIHNTIKHADAHHVTIQLTMRPDTVFDDAHTLELLISDDGVGLAANHPIGVGLVSMRERAAELGGHFVIETTSVYLTCLRVQFPLANTVLYSLP